MGTDHASSTSSTPLIFAQRFLREGEGALPIERCERFLGNTWLRTFADSRREVCSPGDPTPLQAPQPPSAGDGQLPPSAPRGRSRISRWDAATGSRLFWMRNVALDFSRTSNSRDDRDFKPGFVQAACRDEQGASGLDFYKEQTDAGMRGFELLRDAPGGVSGCDEWVDTPTLVAQHDDIGNTYHMLVDFWRVWMSLALLQQPACVPEFEPRIGYEASGPAERPRHPLQDTVCPAPSAASTYFVWAAPGADQQPPPPPDCPPGQVRVHGIDPASMQLLNMDARVMCNVVSPLGVALEGPELDCTGPYFPQYERWFGKGVVRARDFGKRRVCFSALGWAANNPESHIWSYFGSQSECDGPSPLFRQYIDFNMQRWGLTEVAPAVLRPGTAAICGAQGAEGGVEHPLPVRVPSAALNSTNTPAAGGPKQPPCMPYVRLLYVVRKKKPFNPNPVVARTIGNDGEFVAMLEGIGRGVLGNASAVASGRLPPAAAVAADSGGSAGSLDVDVDVDAADFTGMPYEEQLRRVRAAHVMIGMHGAGLIHILHMAGSDAGGGPTGIVELLNRDNDERGIEHLASYGGHKYWRWHNQDIANEGHGGTVITLAEVAPIVREAIRWNVLGRQQQSPARGS